MRQDSEIKIGALIADSSLGKKFTYVYIHTLLRKDSVNKWNSLSRQFVN